ncbi:MAG TPA: ribosomal L7Ae/L30e/S12e/Gadd45 family protein [Longimicrobiaceae bacterium]|nr:ribosomal L7Ae/L30e/S12e/Gadd45 family protein [Longimicrobiaceae bacterium]
MTPRGRRDEAPPRAARPPEEALLDLLGLAARAGAVVTGTDTVRRGIRDGEVAHVILAADASQTQQQKLVPLLEVRGVPYRVLLDRERLGAALGKGAVSAVGLTNRGFAGRAAELADVISSPQE